MQLVCLLTGVLPFGSIFMEAYFVLTSFWNYKFYYVYGFMLLVFIILAIVTSWYADARERRVPAARCLHLAFACLQRDHCGDVHPSECGESSVAVAVVPGVRVDVHLRLPVLHLLLLHQDRVRGPHTAPSAVVVMVTHH
jgi:hypothetical protein